MAHAFASSRVVTPQGIRRAALLLEDGPAGAIRAVCDIADVPASATLVDFGERALLGSRLVDSHVHINEPGRTEWEGFATATARRPLEDLRRWSTCRSTAFLKLLTVEALEIKRAAAAGSASSTGRPGAEPSPTTRPICCRRSAPASPATGASSIYPGCDGFTMIDREQLERALPAIAESGLLQGPRGPAPSTPHARPCATPIGATPPPTWPRAPGRTPGHLP